MRHRLTGTGLLRWNSTAGSRVVHQSTHTTSFSSSLEVAAMEALGRTRWAIAEGYIPSESSSSDRTLISHETACILNATDRDAHVAITIFFADREPVGPYRLTVKARRTLHLR